MYYSQIIYRDEVLYTNTSLWTLEDMKTLLHKEAEALLKTCNNHELYVETVEDEDVLPKISLLSAYDDIEVNEEISSLSKMQVEAIIKEMMVKARELKNNYRGCKDSTSDFADLFGIKVTKDINGGYNISDGGLIRAWACAYPSAIELKKKVLETYGDAIVHHLTKFFGQAE